MSDDNVNQESLPLRPREESSGILPVSSSDRRDPQSFTSVEPEFDTDSPRKSNLPFPSDDGSPMGSSITNRAYHSGSFTFSNNRPGSAGPSDAFSEHGGADYPSPNLSQGRRQVWKRRTTHSASPDRPISRTAAENRIGKSPFGDSEPRLSRTSLSRFPADPAGEEAGPSQLPPPMMRPSPVSNSEEAAPSHLNASQQPGAMLPARRSRQSRENLSYGQESAEGLSNEQKAAGGVSAVAGEEQLINEVRGIYAGLVMVEKKCIEIDKAQSESQAPLDNQKWQALIALHRTLLQEHHDFFMASQHPTASPVLRRLSEKYAMPARMWRYGIHSFLELLRHRLPESLDHMLTFIYLAYSMMTLLLETVPGFQDTWIECLGDLSRYRMAVEESDLKEREVWAGVARYWYNRAADRNPDVGRIQHHLAVLSRPYILQQLFYYTKSLVSVRSFAGTRESILLLFNPILHNPKPSSSSHPHLITAFVAAHGALFGRDSDRFLSSVAEFLPPLDTFITRIGPAFRMQGVHIASANFAAMLEYCHADAPLVGEFQQGTMPQEKSHDDIYTFATETWTPVSEPQKVVSDFVALCEPQRSSRFVFYGSFLAFETMSVFLDQTGDQHIYPALNVCLSFLWCLSRTAAGMKYAEAVVPWRKLVSCLNGMFRPEVNMDYVEQDGYPRGHDCKWAPEDFLIRGQVWSQSCYPPHYFDGGPTDDEGRNIEWPSLWLVRTHKCLWLAVQLAKFNRWITYDSATHEFSVTPFALELEQLVQPYNPFSTTQPDVQMQVS
ncbi:hypothetical protein BDV59DRAFT_189850 [Aspergillus ambiguus]|uniref:uncharacterized protein n=1 Tax=Aspergillus ambiguus TaxID=176160 RepID=UPI003CCDF905